VVKDFILSRNKGVPVFYLRAEDLDKSHLNDVFSAIGMSVSLGQIEGYFSLLLELFMLQVAVVPTLATVELVTSVPFSVISSF
jgi:hypothetical protein